MHGRRLAPLAVPALAAAVLLSGCAVTDASDEPTVFPAAEVSEPSPDAMDASPDAMEHSPTPTPTTEAVAEPPVEVPEVLQFEAMTVAGGPFDGASLAGTDAVLWFGASWCPTCKAEAPAVANAVAQLPDGVTLYGVPGNSDRAGMEAFVEQYGLEDVVHIVDGDGSLWPAFDVPYQPAYAFLNDDGTYRTVQGALGLDGILDGAQELADS